MFNILYYSPLEQFEIVPIFFSILYKIPGYKLLFNYYPLLTNAIIYIFLIKITYMFFFVLPLNIKKVFPKTSWDFMIEKIFLILQDIIRQSFRSNKFQNYMPFIIHTFFYILFSNLLGLMPYGFTNTSFLLQNLMLSISFLIALTLLGIKDKGLHFFEHFVPKGIPVLLIPILVPIEIISYIAKGFSLAVRLFANMMSGHTLLNILSSFSIKLSKTSLLIGIIPFGIVLAIAFLELGISFLQSYVFMVLLTLMFDDSLEIKLNKNIFDYKKYKI